MSTNPGNTTDQGRKHSLALDGLRWWAFFAVFLFHANGLAFWFGRFGVQVFFALSGFLIGRILLVLRADDDVPVRARLTAFYGRRFLRIFPLYYFVLLMIFLLGNLGALKEPRLDVLPYHALYLTNFYLFFSGAQIDSQTHLWSLAVEEHFYLIAPLLMLCAPSRLLKGGILTLIVIAPILRILNSIVWHHHAFEYLSPVQFDILCIGVAAAVIEQQGSFLHMTPARLLRGGGICGALLGVLTVACTLLPGSTITSFLIDVLFPSLVAIASAALVYACWKGRIPRVIAAAFTWAPFVYLGRISYGLYVYHNFQFVWKRLSVLRPHPFVGIGVSLAATVVVATLSWFLLEQPINNLKRFFPYPKSPANV